MAGTIYTADYFKTHLPLTEGEEIKEVVIQGQYLDKSTHQANSCYLVFTNQRMYICIEVKAKKGLFHKKTDPMQPLGAMPYDAIDHLQQRSANGDDTFCCAVMKDGGECIFNIFGDFFGPLAKRVCTYAGRDIPRKRL